MAEAKPWPVRITQGIAKQAIDLVFTDPAHSRRLTVELLRVHQRFMPPGSPQHKRASATIAQLEGARG